MTEDFATYMQNERERLCNDRNALLEQREAIDSSVANIDHEFAALDAYENAKTGKPTRPAASGTRRSRKDSRRDAILNALQASPVSMTRGALLDVLGVKGDKFGEASVSNALTAMLKSGQLARDDGGYKLPDIPSADDVHGILREAAE